jgi:signal transduction histidine kinase
MLHEFVSVNRKEILRRCRARVATRSVPPPTKAEIDGGVPQFLDQLIDALRLGLSSSPEIGRSASLHGHDLRRQGFTLAQVVHDYGEVCQSITELAVEKGAPITADDFRMLNACLDDAVAGAVNQFGREGNQPAIDGGPARENERLGFFAHELRNLIHTAIIAFDVVKSGNVGVAGSTGAVLHRSLVGARDLIGRSLAEVRLTQGVQNREPFLVSGFIEELAPAALLAADARGIAFRVMPVDDGITIEGDRQVLAAVVTNLLQNAFKFTRLRTTVTLRVAASAERVLIEIQDECGGLPEGDANQLFRPFEQANTNRTGLGLGLAFSRWAVEANHGHISARNLPHEGCVFTIDLPRLPLAAMPMSSVKPGRDDAGERRDRERDGNAYDERPASAPVAEHLALSGSFGFNEARLTAQEEQRHGQELSNDQHNDEQ